MGNFVLFAQPVMSLTRQEVKCGKGGSGSEGAWRENMFLDSDLIPKMFHISIPLDSLHIGNAKEPETSSPKSTLLSLIIILRPRSENKEQKETCGELGAEQEFSPPSCLSHWMLRISILKCRQGVQVR